MNKLFGFDNFTVRLDCQLEQLLSIGSYNWVTFDLIKFEVEHDLYLGELSIEAYLLGYGLRIGIAMPNKESEKNIKRLTKELKKVKYGTYKK